MHYQTTLSSPNSVPDFLGEVKVKNLIQLTASATACLWISEVSLDRLAGLTPANVLPHHTALD